MQRQCSTIIAYLVRVAMHMLFMPPQGCQDCVLAAKAYKSCKARSARVPICKLSYESPTTYTACHGNSKGLICRQPNAADHLEELHF
jgi:hypothetical protein